MLKNKKIFLIILVSLSLFGLFLYSSQVISKNLPSPNFPLIKGEEKERSKVILKINEISYEDEITGPISVYGFMSKLRSEGKINFTEKNYIGMGKFIVAINGIRGNEDKNWIYYVNNKKANVGVSNYKINNGDMVSWKYEKSNF